jgi:hypothetical protein
MNKKLLAKSHKKLAKSQKKLKKAFRKLGNVPKAQTPAWVTALATIAGSVATALSDREKRGQLAGVATEAKDKAVGLLTKGEPSEKREKREKREEEEKEEAEAHMPNGIVMEEKPGAV